MTEETNTPEQPEVEEQKVDAKQDVKPEDAKESKPDFNWVPKRISEITAQRRAAEEREALLAEENARLKAQLQSAPVSTSDQSQVVAPSTSVDQLAKAYAEKMVKDRVELESFNRRISDINEAGAKEYGEDFDKSVQNLQMAGIGGVEFLKVLSSIPKPEAVVTWLGKHENINEAMRLGSMDSVQMAVELTKLSNKAPKELSKKVSNAPPPINPIDGGSGSSSGDAEPPITDMKAWVAWRNKNKKSRR